MRKRHAGLEMPVRTNRIHDTLASVIQDNEETGRKKGKKKTHATANPRYIYARDRSNQPSRLGYVGYLPTDRLDN